MLRAADNARVTQVGPGTPMGETMRRYWMPVLPSYMLEPAGPPQRVRLLGEDLVAFRSADGRVGLLDYYCPHRGADLFFGANEDDGLRCVYHGWKFDVTGQCVEQGAEPEKTKFAHKVRTKAYPVEERGGVLWTFMGPRDKMPPLPSFEWMEVEDDKRAVTISWQECNWLQALEGGIDSSHSSFLHNNDIHDMKALRNRSPNPDLEVVETDFGFTYASLRHLPGEGKDYVRIYHFIMPFHQIRASLLPGPGGVPVVPQVSGHMWVPIDDENTRVFNWTYTFGDKPLVERNNYRGGKTIEPIDYWEAGRPIYQRRRSNDYLIDRDLQKRKVLTGIANTTTQDRGIQESMGRIVDRSREHLGASDRAIIMARKQLLKTIDVVQDGGNPPGLQPLPNLRAYEDVVPTGTDWKTVFHGKLYAREGGTPVMVGVD